MKLITYEKWSRDRSTCQGIESYYAENRESAVEIAVMLLKKGEMSKFFPVVKTVNQLSDENKLLFALPHFCDKINKEIEMILKLGD